MGRNGTCARGDSSPKSPDAPDRRAVTEYLLDTSTFAAYINGRQRIVQLVEQLLASGEDVRTSIVVYGEVVEYLGYTAPHPNSVATLRSHLGAIHPIPVSVEVMERYAII